jgi:alpha-amylase
MHKKLIYELFKVSPTSFRNTEHFINNRILDKIQGMGYHITLCEYRPDMDVVQHLPLDHPGRGVRTHKVFKSINGLTTIPRDRWISDGPGFRFGNEGENVTADTVSAYLANIAGEVVGVFIDGEHIGEHKWVETGIFNFYWYLPKALARYGNIKMATPSEVAGMFYPVDCPTIDIDHWSTSSWADKDKDTKGWLGSKEQYEMFVRLEGLEPKLKKIGGEPLKLWRYLTTSCNLHNCYKSNTPDGGVHDYFSAYDDPDQAIAVFKSALDYLDNLVRHYQTVKPA